MAISASTSEQLVRFGDLSASGQVRLLDLSFERVLFGVRIMPFVALPFLYWLHVLHRDATRLGVWIGAYLLLIVVLQYLQKAYRRDRADMPDPDMMRIWLPRMHVFSLLHGCGLSALIVTVVGDVPFEFMLLLYFSIAAIMAANATHQAPVLSAFRRFFASSWGMCCLLTPWTFPAHWPFVMPLTLTYVLSIYRHSKLAHQFFVRQIVLEEDGIRLAEGYRQARDQAQQALLDKNRFLTTASHDLRQPVHAMGFLIESIAHRNRDDALVKPLSDLRQSVRAVTQMFNSLLDLSKIESGAVDIRLEPLDLDAMMNEVATLFREEARANGIELRVRLTSGKAWVNADALLLRQSMVNLMHNALRYTLRGGVLMAARRRGGDWLFDVWDTGIGVALADQDQIYSPFFRHEHAWRIDSAGHGLGLSVVARCADLMNAGYGLSSREGRGSRFWLRLPAAEDFQKRSVHELPVKTALRFTPARLSGSCLVVDDDPQVCAAWQSLLAAWGIDVVCVASSVQAADVLDGGFRPDAIFCDQRLRAGESGFELLCALLDRFPHARGAMISGEFDSPELKRAEADGYLVMRKPVQPESLHAVMSAWLVDYYPRP